MIKLIYLILSLREVKKVNKAIKSLKQLDFKQIEVVDRTLTYLEIYKKEIKEGIKSGKLYEGNRKDSKS